MPYGKAAEMVLGTRRSRCLPGGMYIPSYRYIYNTELPLVTVRDWKSALFQVKEASQQQ